MSNKINEKNNIVNHDNNSNQKKCRAKGFFATLKNSFKNIFSSRVFLAIFFLLIGILTTNSCQKHQEYKKSHHSFFDDDFYEDDFFSEFDQLHEKMHRAMLHHRKMMHQAFEEHYKESSKSENQQKLNKITASLNFSEDENFMNYELNFSGINPEQINVLTENNYLIFTAKQADISSTSSENNLSQSSSQSNFYYAVNINNFDEKTKPEITKTNDKILVKLKKISSKKLKEKSVKKGT